MNDESNNNIQIYLFIYCQSLRNAPYRKLKFEKSITFPYVNVHVFILSSIIDTLPDKTDKLLIGKMEIAFFHASVQLHVA